MDSRTTIDRSQLFKRLSQDPAAGLVVLTPNRRLAQAFEAEYDRMQLGRGLESWDAPDILPFDTFVERCYEEALYAPGGAGLPALL